MTLKPILFNTDMVCAILRGQKTVTRRPVKPQPKMRLSYACMGHGAGRWGYPAEDVHKYWGDEWRIPDDVTLDEADRNRLWTPPCHTDDILYVRETWAPLYPDDVSKEVCGYMYKADREMFLYGEEYAKDYDELYPEGRDWTWEGVWKPSIHMPREAARLFLKVTNVSVGKLQDITMEGIRREGCVPQCAMCSFNRKIDTHGIDCAKGISRDADCPLSNMFETVGFRSTWDSTVKKSDLMTYGWKADPYVWLIEFERIEKPGI